MNFAKHAFSIEAMMNGGPAKLVSNRSVDNLRAPLL
jgi:hypothetical protein